MDSSTHDPFLALRADVGVRASSHDPFRGVARDTDPEADLDGFGAPDTGAPTTGDFDRGRVLAYWPADRQRWGNMVRIAPRERDSVLGEDLAAQLLTYAPAPAFAQLRDLSNGAVTYLAVGTQGATPTRLYFSSGSVPTWPTWVLLLGSAPPPQRQGGYVADM